MKKSLFYGALVASMFGIGMINHQKVNADNDANKHTIIVYKFDQNGKGFTFKGKHKETIDDKLYQGKPITYNGQKYYYSPTVNGYVKKSVFKLKFTESNFEKEMDKDDNQDTKDTVKNDIISSDNQSSNNQDDSNNSDQDGSDNSNDNSQDTAQMKTMTINFVDSSGKTIASPETVSTNDPSYQMIINDNTISPSINKAISGYVEIPNPRTVYYDSLPSNITIRYAKISSTVNALNNTYMKLVNKARQSKGLYKYTLSNSLQKKVNTRAKEETQLGGHIRPNGTSYNTKNSGYAEVYAGVDLVSDSASTNIDINKTAAATLNFLLTEDDIHRDTVLNKWAKSSNVAFNIDDEGNVVMVQLFSLK